MKQILFHPVGKKMTLLPSSILSAQHLQTALFGMMSSAQQVPEHRTALEASPVNVGVEERAHTAERCFIVS